MQADIALVVRQQFTSAQSINLLKPSAQAVAMWRAAHQLLEQPPIFVDPIALPILGDEQNTIANNLDSHRDILSTAMRTAIAVRSQFAEDQRRASDATQFVILGAGLDTYAYREQRENETVFEVDLPQLQQIKINRLRLNKIKPTSNILYVPCNFEQNSLAQSLLAAGFDSNCKTFFSWLGVVPYLTQKAIDQTLNFILACAPGSKVVFDYIVDPGSLSDIEKIVIETLGAQLAVGGEHLQTFYRPEQLQQQLIAAGFSAVTDIDAAYLNRRYLEKRRDGLGVGNVSRMLVAEVGA